MWAWICAPAPNAISLVGGEDGPHSQPQSRVHLASIGFTHLYKIDHTQKGMVMLH